MGNIDFLKNIGGATIYPVTLLSAVYDIDGGSRLDEILNAKQNIKRCMIKRETSTSGTNTWYKFASCRETDTHCDRTITFLVQNPYMSAGIASGILTAHIRTNSNKQMEACKLYWHYVAKGIDPNNFRLYYNNDSSGVDVQLWCNVPTAWHVYTFIVLNESSRSTFPATVWNLHNASGEGQSSPPQWNYKGSELMDTRTAAESASTANKLTTARTIALTGAVTGSVTFDGSTNVNMTTSVNHTHSYLPLSGGTMTGVIKSSYASGSWLSGNRGNTVISCTCSAGAYAGILRYPSTNGVFQLSGYHNSLTLVYTSNSTINNSSNSYDKRANLLLENGNTEFPGQVSANKFSGPLSGNASTATTLQTARTINGTSFNGSANITTSKWGTARTLTIGNKGKSVDGSGNVSWSLSEIFKHSTAIGNKATNWDNITQPGLHVVAIECTNYDTSNCTNGPKSMYSYGMLVVIDIGEVVWQIYLPHVTMSTGETLYISKSSSFSALRAARTVAWRGKWSGRDPFSNWEYCIGLY